MKWIIAISIIFMTGCGEKYDTRGEEIQAAVEKMSFDEPVYWLEMLNMFNEWEKTILVFGYMGNYEACLALQEVASKDSPNRQFRYTQA
ncbi:hypothetical protein AB8615_08090 [Litorimonas sp. RW-G-Af-16]|uniref:hypothetical protein n=1 Tax=Litorimonas sp. RW-G-Af-16 TaxID=3241168 RepID=UPI003AAB2F4B